MTVPTPDQALRWRPESLLRLADAWDDAARLIHRHVATPTRVGARWSGAAADAARDDAGRLAADGDALARALVSAAVAARDGAGQIGAALADVTAGLDRCRAEGFRVGDDGVVVPDATPSALLILLSGNDVGVAGLLRTTRAAELTRELRAALTGLGAADDDAAADVREALESVDLTVDAGLGNTDGVPWAVRIAANRTNVAQAVVDGLDDTSGRTDFYRGLLAEIEDPAGTGVRIDRNILAFDPGRASLVELNGDLDTARSLAVLVPGMNTTIAGSASTTASARRFVTATRGEVAAITYLGGPFPQDESPVVALAEAASPRFAIDMAPRLVSFGHAVDAAVDATGRTIPVTYVGHSYGGAILGTAEALGLRADRTLYAAAAGAGFGVDGPGDWHNRNPDVLRFSMTAPGDPIHLVQGLPGGPHGADPDEMRGVIHLATGRYDDGRPMAGPRAHGDVLAVPGSDAWRNVLAVITGDREHIVLAG